MICKGLGQSFFTFSAVFGRKSTKAPGSLPHRVHFRLRVCFPKDRRVGSKGCRKRLPERPSPHRPRGQSWRAEWRLRTWGKAPSLRKACNPKGGSFAKLGMLWRASESRRAPLHRAFFRTRLRFRRSQLRRVSAPLQPGYLRRCLLPLQVPKRVALYFYQTRSCFPLKKQKTAPRAVF